MQLLRRLPMMKMMMLLLVLHKSDLNSTDDLVSLIPPNDAHQNSSDDSSSSLSMWQADGAFEIQHRELRLKSLNKPKKHLLFLFPSLGLCSNTVSFFICRFSSDYFFVYLVFRRLDFFLAFYIHIPIFNETVHFL